MNTKRIVTFFAVLLLTAAYGAAQTGPTLVNGFFRQEGIASWYGTEFDGRPTASGESFNSALFTAAHPSLPFGTMLRITNRHNNRQVVVKVNDRGPFVSTRIIDLSQAAAQQLDMINTGTAPVLVESLESMNLSSLQSAGGASGGAAITSPSQITAPELAPLPPEDYPAISQSAASPSPPVQQPPAPQVYLAPTPQPYPAQSPAAAPAQQSYPAQAQQSYPAQPPATVPVQQSYPAPTPQPYPAQPSVVAPAPQTYPAPTPQPYPAQPPVAAPTPQTYPAPTPQPYPAQPPAVAPAQQSYPAQAQQSYPAQPPAVAPAPQPYPAQPPAVAPAPQPYPAQPPAVAPAPQSYPAQPPAVAPAPQTYPAQPEAAPIAPAAPSSSAPPPARPAVVPAAGPLPPAEITGTAPALGTGKTYRIQVGAYRNPRNAAEVFDKLKNVGLNAAYERSDDVYRVVLAGVKAEEVQGIAEKLGMAGFREALIREER